jgi:putative transposase
LNAARRGLAVAPELAVADGALGFWQAIEEVWPQTRGQRCWVHKTANVLNKLPKSQQSKAKRALQEIWMAETKKDALSAFDVFIETWAVKYEKAVECLVKDRDPLLAFYDFPAEHWKHVRTTNVIESSFATPWSAWGANARKPLLFCLAPGTVMSIFIYSSAICSWAIGHRD